jgi:hypothetical protein
MENQEIFLSMHRLSTAVRNNIIRNTSSRDMIGTRKLVVACSTDPALRHKIDGCNGRAPCWSPACPACAGRRGRRYFRDSLGPALDGVDPDDLRWVSVNVTESDCLAAGANLLATTEHRALRHIMSNLRVPRYIRSEVMPAECRPRVWGAREVEPVRQPHGSFRWLWHWHMIVKLDGIDVDLLADALRIRWPGARAVRVQPIKATSPRQLNRSLSRLAVYPVKARYTYRTGLCREWLPPDEIDKLSRWRASLSSNWTRFSIR